MTCGHCVNAVTEEVGEIDEVSAIITDTSATPEMVAALQERGVEVILA